MRIYSANLTADQIALVESQGYTYVNPQAFDHKLLTLQGGKIGETAKMALRLDLVGLISFIGEDPSSLYYEDGSRMAATCNLEFTRNQDPQSYDLCRLLADEAKEQGIPYRGTAPAFIGWPRGVAIPYFIPTELDIEVSSPEEVETPDGIRYRRTLLVHRLKGEFKSNAAVMQRLPRGYKSPVA